MLLLGITSVHFLNSLALINLIISSAPSCNAINNPVAVIDTNNNNDNDNDNDNRYVKFTF